MDFDAVRAEKEEAMRRYNRQRNLRIFVRIAALLSLLVLFVSWSSPQIPAAIGIVREFSRSFKSVLHPRQYVFLLINALILAIYFSYHNNAGVAQPDVYDEYLSKSASAAADLRSPPSKIATRNPHSPAKKIGKTKSAPVVVTECPVPTTESEIKVTEARRRHRRSQSGSFERQAAAAPGKLRRSETQNGRETAAGKQSMEEMSSEEFRITVESFIAKKRRDLREQHLPVWPSLDTVDHDQTPYIFDQSNYPIRSGH